MVIWTGILTVAQEALTEAAFEAATIKRNVSGSENWSLNPRPTGQFTVTNGRAFDIVQAAFLVQDYHFDGLPAWTRNERSPKAAPSRRPSDRGEALIGDRRQACSNHEGPDRFLGSK